MVLTRDTTPANTGQDSSSKQPLKMSRNQLLALVSALMAMTALAIDMMLPAFGDIRTAFHLRAGSADTAMIITTFMLGLAFAQLFWGPFADRYGRRPAMYGGLSLYALSAVACAFAPSFGWLLLGRFVWGVGAAGTRVVAVAIVRDRFEGEAMARAMSQVMAVFVLVPIVAPTIGSVMVALLPWRGVFLVGGLFALPLAVWGLRLEETLDPVNVRPMSVGAIWSAFGEVARTRITAGYTLASVFLQGVFTAWLPSSEVLINDVFDRKHQFPLVFGGIAMTFGAGAISNGWVVARVGIRRAINLAFAIILPLNLVLLAVSLLSDGRPQFWIYIPMLAVILASFMFLMPNLNAAAMTPMGHIAGTAAAVTGAARMALGAVLGTIIADKVVDSTTPFTVGLVVMCLLAGVSVVFGRSAEHVTTS